MRGKRLLAAVMSVFLMASAVPTTAHAGILEDIKEMPNAEAYIVLENYSCEEYAALVEKEELSVKIDSETLDEPVVIPAKPEIIDGEVWLWYGTEKVEDALMRQLAEIQGEIENELDEDAEFNLDKTTKAIDSEVPALTIKEVRDILTNVKASFGEFEVTVEGLPENHYKEVGEVVIITSEVIKETVDFIMEIMEEEFGKEFENFSEVIAEFEVMCQEEFGMTLDELLVESGFEGEDLELLRELLANVDEIVNYFLSEEFPGYLTTEVYLECDCPMEDYYWITHLYFEKTDKGLKLIDEVYDESEDGETFVGMEGDIIYAKDFIREENNGLIYEYVGSYSEYYYDDDAVDYDGNISSLEAIEEYKMDSLELGGEYSELCLMYVKDAEPVTESVDVGDEDDSTDEEDMMVSGMPENEEAAPPTGDMNDSSKYLLSAFASVIVIAGCVYYRKKENM